MTDLVDDNVLLDVMTEDSGWSAWLGETLALCTESFALAINPSIDAEVSIRLDRIEEMRDALPEGNVLRLPLPWEAAILAGKSDPRAGMQTGRGPLEADALGPGPRAPSRVSARLRVRPTLWQPGRSHHLAPGEVNGPGVRPTPRARMGRDSRRRRAQGRSRPGTESRAR